MSAREVRLTAVSLSATRSCDGFSTGKTARDASVGDDQNSRDCAGDAPRLGIIRC